MSKKRYSSSRGFSLVAALLLMLLISALSVALMYSVNTEQKISTADQEQNIARYAAEGAEEKMIADVASMYSQKGAPLMVDIQNLGGPANTPTFPGVTITNYQITADPSQANPALPATVTKIQKSGTYAFTIPIHMDVVATTSSGTQVHINRDSEIALLPVFQFGVFSDSDLSFFPGPQFDFNGRVFTNGNLFLAASTNALSFHTKIQTARDVVRKVLVNNADVSAAAPAAQRRTANVLIPVTSGGCDTIPAPTNPITGPPVACQFFDQTMSSLNSGNPYVEDVTENKNPSWSATSSNFGGNIQTRWDGVTPLTLPFVGGAANNPNAPPPAPWEIIKRPPNNGAPDLVGTSREYNLAQIRILLDDKVTDLPGGQQFGGTGASLDVNLGLVPQTFNVDGAGVQSFAQAERLAYDATQTAGKYNCTYAKNNCVSPDDPDAGWYGTAATWPLITGWLRVEYRDAAGNWNNVTQEWLQRGFARGPQSPNNDPSAVPAAAGPNTVHKNAILIFQKRPNPLPPDLAGDTYVGPYISGTLYTKNQVVTYNTSPTTTPVKYYICIKNTTGTQNPTNATYWTPMAQAWGYTKLAALNDPTYGWFPLNMYDPREGEFAHNTNPQANSCAVGGLMNVVELDIGNLTQWLLGNTGVNGAKVDTTFQNGYIVYFSDRRGMQTRKAFPLGELDGEYGYEPVVDPLDATWSPRGLETASGLETQPPAANLLMGGAEGGEDINGTVVTINGGGDTFIATHGRLGIGAGFGKANGTGLANNPALNPLPTDLVWPPALGASANGSTLTGDPGDLIDSPAARIMNCSQIGQSNMVTGARHALKLVNGSKGNFRYNDANGNPIGLTIASEQPVYVQGNYNADNNDGTNWANYQHLSTAVIADAVTLLSNAFDDRYSLEYPTSGPGGTPRTATETYFRVAIAAGKNRPFFQPGNWGSGNGDTGTDGGVHNFIRYLEDWSATKSHYRGSLVSMYYARYGNGIYGNSWVYVPPSRDYSFDTDFLNPNLLPPGTPKLIDMDNLSAHQDLTPRTY